MRTFKLLSLSVLSFIALACCVAVSQVPQGYLNDTGNPAYSVTVPVENGYIDVSNGNLHLEFPIASAPQRGSLTLNQRLVYDSRIWMFSPFGSNGSYHWWPYNVYGASTTSGGWRFVQGNEVGTVSSTFGTSNSTPCPYPMEDQNLTTTTSSIVWTDPNGTVHPFNASFNSTENDCSFPYNPVYSQSLTPGPAADGSGYYVKDDGSGQPLVIDNNGTQVYPQIIDRYGNFLSQDSSGNLIDDTGRTPVIVTQNGNTTYYDVLAPNGPINNNGLRVRYTVTTGLIDVDTYFNQGSIHEWLSPENPGDTPLMNPVQSITLPDGSQYTFSYDFYGEVTAMTLPTGGTVHFGYSNWVDSSQTANRWLTSMWRGNDPPTTFTQYVVAQCVNYGSACKEMVIVHKPSGDETAYNLTLDNGAWNSGASVYSGPAFQRGGTVLSSFTNTYALSNGCTNGVCIGGNYITQSLATVDLYPNGIQSQPVATQTFSTYDHITGKLTAQKHWDYVPDNGSNLSYITAPITTPTREIDYSYSGYDLQNVSAYDSNGNLAGQTIYGYTSTPTRVTTNVAQHGTQNAGGPYLSTITHWLNGGTSPFTTIGMDDTGQVVSAQDAKGNPATTINYECENSLPASVMPLQSATYETTYVHDCGSGAITQIKDPNDNANNRSGTIYTYESGAGRLHSVTYPDGGSTTYSYPSSTEVDTTVAAFPDPTISSADILDSYGRPYQHSQNGITGETTYDSNGRSYCVTSPHTSSSSSTDGTTCITSYDGLDRPLTQQQPDGNTIQWAYAANTITTTDEASHQTQRTSDAFGRLTSVIETPSAGVSYTTNYTYDGLGNLYQVNQLGRSGTDTPEVRTFVHDSLGRLVSSTVPEQGAATTYSYVSNGAFCSGDITLPCSETDARGITTSYSYDALNRLGHITYSDGTPGRWYEYDITSSWMGPQYNTIGRLAEANTDTDTRYTSGVSNPNSPYAWTDELYSYDAMGRVNRIGTAFPSESGHAAHETDMTYDLAGNMTSLRYPDGRVVTQGIDAAGHLQSVTFDNWNGQHVGYTYASGFTYTPAGAQAEVTYGNGIYIHTPYNDRQQMCQVWASNSTQPLIDTHIYFAGGTNFCVSATGNNGNISQIKDWRNPAHTRYFGYDDLNRLNSFTNGDGSMQQTYGYDSFGNLTQSGTLNFQVTYDANNHINSGGVGYDAAGNVTQVNVAGINTNYSFDGAGRLYNVNSGAAYYTYDGNGNRMRKDLNGSYTEYQYLNGQVIAERQSDGTWTDYIYANGQKIAKADAARPLIHAHGVRDNTISMACGSVWWLSGSGVPAGYTIRSGDKLVFDQLETVAHAGPSIAFTDGTDTTWNQDPQNPVFLTFDQNGENTADSTQDDGQWHHRIIDLTPVVGKTISSSNNFAHATEADTPAGTWDVYYANMALVSTDGTVQPIFTGQQIGSSLWSACGGHDLSLATEPISLTTDPIASTTYYIGDQIGSTRMVAGSGGWPVSTSILYPFGQEQSPTGDPKFAGLEYDQETGLYHAAARQYTSVAGRWLSPDPFDGSMDISDPQTLNRYSYVGNNPLMFTDPSGMFRTDGGFENDYNLNPVNDIARGLEQLFSLFGGGHHISGTTAKRPKVLGSPDFGVPYHGLNAGIAEALGLPGAGCEFGACYGGPEGYTDTVSVFHPSELTCAIQGAVAGALDFTGLSMVPGTNQDNWKWYYASASSFGFRYVGGAESDSLLGISGAVYVADKGSDAVKEDPVWQSMIRKGARNQGYKISTKAVAKDASAISKVAKPLSFVLTGKAALGRYRTCRGF